MFYEIASRFQGTLKRFVPYATIDDISAWNALDDTWKNEIRKAADAIKGYTYSSLPASMFMDFTRIGNRSNYEDLFFAKRRALNTFVLAECVTQAGNYMDDIINGIFSICEESAWQLPAHNSYIRDTPCLPLPDTTDPVLDLFACETGALLATVHYLLANKLDQVSPTITKRIRAELKHRIYTPYLSKHFWWMGHGDEPMCNWTIWCTQNVLLSVFLLPNEPCFQKDVFLKASKSTDYFLKEYGDDGCCDEGAQYYRHSGLCLFNTIEILNAITDGYFSSVYKEVKIRNMALYIQNVHIQDKYYANFADCSPVAGRAGVREYLFGKRIESTSMMQFAAEDFLLGKDLLLASEINLYYRLQNAFTIKEINAFQSDEPVVHSDIYYPSVGLFLARDNNYCVAVKAGDNNDSHNHNDTGSFTIYKNGQPFVIDVGVETYCQKTFSPRRYEIWTMQSAYHNLPTIHGQMQLPGADYKATDVSVSLGDEVSKIHMNIASAYPEEAHVTSYERTVTFQKDTSIRIQDSFTCNPWKEGDVVLSLMTYEKPVFHNHSLFIGSLGEISMEEEVSVTIEEIPITDARLQTAWDHEVYRTLITPKTTTITMEIKQ
ncbi:heparinase II/III domain-containing protein [Anaerosporobacter faecicola]|uniref:heparinase II/III domain-containing protein n=1 Tax=Anaerosporobacter faecicola TaxID=2718714 RepID=UPI00143CBBB0|nr:heparinase II/III family protein [Anaerosporobacter faecicola]